MLQLLAYTVLSLLTLYLVVKLFLSFTAADGHEDAISAIEGAQDIVIVTVFDNTSMSEDYIRMVRVNRDDYAARHGT